MGGTQAGRPLCSCMQWLVEGTPLALLVWALQRCVPEPACPVPGWARAWCGAVRLCRAEAATRLAAAARPSATGLSTRCASRCAPRARARPRHAGFWAQRLWLAALAADAQPLFVLHLFHPHNRRHGARLACLPLMPLSLPVPLPAEQLGRPAVPVRGPSQALLVTGDSLHRPARSMHPCAARQSGGEAALMAAPT